MAKIKQYALCTIARKKTFPTYNVLDCIKFKEKNGVFPFSDTPWEYDEWIYDYYVEYYKKFKTSWDNEFFTPIKYAINLSGIYRDYFPEWKEVVLDAFCWIWNLTIWYYENVEAFDCNQEFLDICNYKLNNPNIQKWFEYKLFQFSAFNFDYNKKKFEINKLDKKYNCIVSNPPFGKYRGSVIDKAVIYRFAEHLNSEGILIAILPPNFYDKYKNILDELFLFHSIGDEVVFDYTNTKARIFVFKKK